MWYYLLCNFDLDLTVGVGKEILDTCCEDPLLGLDYYSNRDTNLRYPILEEAAIRALTSRSRDPHTLDLICLRFLQYCTNLRISVRDLPEIDSLLSDYSYISLCQEYCSQVRHYNKNVLKQVLRSYITKKSRDFSDIVTVEEFLEDIGVYVFGDKITDNNCNTIFGRDLFIEVISSLEYPLNDSMIRRIGSYMAIFRERSKSKDEALQINIHRWPDMEKFSMKSGNKNLQKAYLNYIKPE